MHDQAQISKTSASSKPREYKKVSEQSKEQQAEQLRSELSAFTGTEQYFKHWLGFRFTDGVKYLAEKSDCFWLLDAIGSYQHKVRNVSFQLWTLRVNEDSSAILEMKEDTNEPVIVKQEIPYTDFPMKELKLYYIDGVLLLPSEY